MTIRYFYLLCILLTINGVLCFTDHSLKQKHERRLGERNRVQHRKEKAESKHQDRSQDYAWLEDREPIAQIDVASFVQKPEEYPFDNNLVYETDTKKSDTNLNAYDYGSLSEYNLKDDLGMKSYIRPRYQTHGADKPNDLGPNILPYSDIVNPRHMNLDSLSFNGLNNGKIGRSMASERSGMENGRAFHDADSVVHNPEKKRAIKEMLKLPFFFRNKTEVTKPKKAKKRKIFCFNCSSKKDKEKMSTALSAETPKKETLETTLPKVLVGDTSDGSKPNEIKRYKRDEWVGDREKQLKELEEIQRKVDSVEILPAYGKQPEKSS